MPEQTEPTLTQQERLQQEFEEVRALNPEGLLKVEDALLWAKQHKQSALYQFIDANQGWQDKVAAQRWREELVRRAIRLVVTHVDAPAQRVYLSLPTDRTHGGGYRPTEDALRKGRQEMVNECLKRLLNLRNSYTHLPELDPVFSAVEQAVRSYQALPQQQAS